MPLRRHLRLQNSLGRSIPSELSAHQMCMRRRFRLQDLLGRFDSIRAELPSNGYPQPSGSLPHSAHSNPLRHIWADWVFPLQDPFKHYGFRSRQGWSPARHAPLLVPLSTSAFVRPALFFLFMRVRRWMPRHLPGSPRSLFPTRSSSPSTLRARRRCPGPRRWMPLGAVFACFVLLSYVGFLTYHHWVFAVYVLYATTATTSSRARCVDAQRRVSCPHDVLWVRLQSPDTRRYGVPFIRGGESCMFPLSAAHCRAHLALFGGQSTYDVEVRLGWGTPSNQSRKKRRFQVAGPLGSKAGRPCCTEVMWIPRIPSSGLC